MELSYSTKEKESDNFPKSYILVMKSTHISIPFYKIRINLFLYIKINKPRALIQTLSLHKPIVSDIHTNLPMGKPLNQNYSSLNTLTKFKIN